MTQTSALPAADTDGPPMLAAWTAWDRAMRAAADIPADGAYGALIRFVTERLDSDPRGPRGWAFLDTYADPFDADVVLQRMVAEERVIFSVEAVRGALGGTTRV